MIGETVVLQEYQQLCIRRVWRYQRGNQNPYIEEEQTTQWPKEKVQKDKQRSTKHTYKTKDRVIRTPLKTGDELRCYRRVSSSCSTSDTRRVNLVTNPVISQIIVHYLTDKIFGHWPFLFIRLYNFSFFSYSDVKKARLLLKSVRETNPKHPPGK
jgi:hypothetical protein